MFAHKGKKPKVPEIAEVADSDDIDDDRFLSVEKLQEVQDELEKFLCDPALCDLLSEEDQKIFKYIDSIDMEDFKDLKSGYSITFNMNENPYFEDAKLTKTLTFYDEGATKITGTEIKWKEGKAASNGVEDVKKGNKRPLSEESFFSWFSETQQKDIAELHEEIAEIIKEDSWPNPLKCLKMETDVEDSDGEEEDS
ncbi:NAP1-related protein 1-like isoform X3 [Carya illinoinensis]|uniref:NAP1-related protein 1-like isoform X3 n=1 Tax=Carya illinoinensis TaxID=32201 RepID=UPI001C727576|nr:NAP1-related protein 1-like isoform X3 [Carya illinoinensis]